MNQSRRKTRCPAASFPSRVEAEPSTAASACACVLLLVPRTVVEDGGLHGIRNAGYGLNAGR